ncbi:uncharacterized protein LOC135593028 isoform X2 [Musa acuminata AAA Group]|uniref:uncharacterized protein LOC135593028 isoform X2 n=1 Tax=Musa acuminata AAA Group TaxID=214697 RepID=UPI0031DCA80D
MELLMVSFSDLIADLILVVAPSSVMIQQNCCCVASTVAKITHLPKQEFHSRREPSPGASFDNVSSCESLSLDWKAEAEAIKLRSFHLMRPVTVPCLGDLSTCQQSLKKRWETKQSSYTKQSKRLRKQWS